MSRRRPSIVQHLLRSIPVDSHLLVCVSGGRDSMVLLDALVRIKRRHRLRLTVCHIDHGFRAESATDADTVVDRARRYGLPYHVQRLGPRPAGSNLEAWARQQRYAVFVRLLTEVAADAFVTAHTANDVAETLVMRLLASKEVTSIESADPYRRCLRPLLGVSRAEITEYAQQFGIPYLDDPTNQDPSFTRNRIRLRVLPLLEEQFGRSVVWSLSQQARSLAADCEALREWGRREAAALGPLQHTDAEWLQRCRQRLEQLPAGVRWRCLEALLEPVLGYRVGERLATAAAHAVLGTGQAVTVTVGDVVLSLGAKEKRAV